MQQEAKRHQKVKLCEGELLCQSCSQAGTCCGACRTNPGWHLEFKAKTVTDTPRLPGTASLFMLCDENTHLYLTKCGAWGTLHPALSIVYCVCFAMETPSFPRVPTPSSPPFTSPRVWVSFFATYNLGTLLFGLLLIRSS